MTPKSCEIDKSPLDYYIRHIYKYNSNIGEILCFLLSFSLIAADRAASVLRGPPEPSCLTSAGIKSID